MLYFVALQNLYVQYVELEPGATAQNIIIYSKATQTLNIFSKQPFRKCVSFFFINANNIAIFTSVASNKSKQSFSLVYRGHQGFFLFCFFFPFVSTRDAKRVRGVVNVQKLDIHHKKVRYGHLRLMEAYARDAPIPNTTPFPCHHSEPLNINA